MILDTINTKLERLHTILSAILPYEHLSKHPFVYFNKRISKLSEICDTIISESQSELDNLIDECNILQKTICMKSINTKLIFINSKFSNFNLKKEFLKNELHKQNLKEKELKDEIDFWLNKIKITNEEIYDKKFIQNEVVEISHRVLENIKEEHNKLLLIKNNKEKHRQEMIEKINNWGVRLNKQLQINIKDKIGYIERIYEEYKIEVEEKEIMLEGLRKNIEEISNLMIDQEGIVNDIEEGMENNNIKEDIVINIENTYINIGNTLKNRKDNLSEEYLFLYSKYLKYLEEEYKTRINEIYKKNKLNLENLLKLFNQPMEIYEEGSIGIKKIKNRIKELESKKEAFFNITNLINKRKMMLESMNEFEKIASDPKRLFKSSFQLNKEEKFRKCAYPSLLRIEDELRNKLEEYDRTYSNFLYNGSVYSDVLKEEVEGRIINKTVFINRYDSPYKRKGGR